MKYILIPIMLFYTFTCLSQNFGTKVDPLKGFNEKLKIAGENTKSIMCNFEQTKFMAVLAKPNISTGKFYYKKEQNICLEYNLPKGNLIVMSQGKFKIISEGKKTVLDMKSNPMMQQMGTMLSACMTGDLKLFGSDSQTEYYESKLYYTVIIMPTNKKLKKYLKQIILKFDKQDMTLETMLMKENDTDYTQYEFKDKKLNSTIDPDKFKI